MDLGAVRSAPYGTAVAVYSWLLKEWAWVSGLYALQTGRDLRDLNPRLLYDIGFSLLREQSKLYKEQAEAMESVEDIFEDIEFEADTGLPAIARKYGGALGAQGTGPFIM